MPTPRAGSAPATWKRVGRNSARYLLALRAHDQRIEDNLSDLLHLYIPKAPESLRTIVAVATGGEEKRIHYREHDGAPGAAQVAVERVLDGKSTLSQEFSPITETFGSATRTGTPRDVSPLSTHRRRATRRRQPAHSSGR